MLGSLFNNVAGLEVPVSPVPDASNFIRKDTQTQMLSCEFCEIFKNIFLQNTSGGCF